MAFTLAFAFMSNVKHFIHLSVVPLVQLHKAINGVYPSEVQYYLKLQHIINASIENKSST